MMANLTLTKISEERVLYVPVLHKEDSKDGDLDFDLGHINLGGNP